MTRQTKEIWNEADNPLFLLEIIFNHKINLKIAIMTLCDCIEQIKENFIDKSCLDNKIDAVRCKVNSLSENYDEELQIIARSTKMLFIVAKYLVMNAAGKKTGSIRYFDHTPNILKFLNTKNKPSKEEEKNLSLQCSLEFLETKTFIESSILDSLNMFNQISSNLIRKNFPWELIENNLI
jgi:hypothetical protein